MNPYRKIWFIRNIPNALTLSRIILSFILVFLALNRANFMALLIVFVIAAMTDAADGFIARRHDLITHFGRKMDPIADRILTISAVFSLIMYMLMAGQLNITNLVLISITMTREILCAPVFIVALFIKKSRKFPHARWIGKITTAVQAVTLALILLGWKIAPLAAVTTAVLGVVCCGYFIYDSIVDPNNRVQKRWDNYYFRYD